MKTDRNCTKNLVTSMGRPVAQITAGILDISKTHDGVL